MALVEKTARSIEIHPVGNILVIDTLQVIDEDTGEVKATGLPHHTSYDVGVAVDPKESVIAAIAKARWDDATLAEAVARKEAALTQVSAAPVK